MVQVGNDKWEMIRKLTVIFFLAAVSSGTAVAQNFRFYNPDSLEHVAEDNNRDAQGHVVRGAYLTNQWFDNWAFGIAGGVQTTYAPVKGAGLRFTPAFDIYAMKWVTPTVAARFGFQGFKMEEQYPLKWMGRHYAIARDADDPTIARYKQTYFHVDLLFSVTNFFAGYRESRTLNLSPYLHAGYLRLGHPDYSYFNSTYRDREIAFGFGLYSAYKITNHISATSDLRVSNFSGRYHDEDGGRVNSIYLTVGASYTIFKWYWERHATAIAPLRAGYDDAIASLEAVENENKELIQVTEELKNANINLNITNKQLEDKVQAQAAIDSRRNPNDELLHRVANAEIVLYYELDIDKLSPTESLRLENYVIDTYQADRKHVFYITGSADKGTGSASHNAKLSRRRAENVKKTLVRDYGIPASQVVIKASIVSDKHADGRLDRCVLFENE